MGIDLTFAAALDLARAIVPDQGLTDRIELHYRTPLNWAPPTGTTRSADADTLGRAGLLDAQEITRTWSAPVRLYAGQQHLP